MNTEKSPNDRERRLDRVGEILAKALAASRMASDLPKESEADEAPKDTDEIEELLGKYGELSVSEVMELAGISRSTAHRRLTSLTQKGKVASKGKGRATRYISVEAQP